MPGGRGARDARRAARRAFGLHGLAAGVLTAVAAGLGLLLAAAPSLAQDPPPVQHESFLVSRSVAGDFPNGSSGAAAFSQDRQLASLIAFQSEASNVAPGDGNGPVSDVFLVRRANPLEDRLRALPWRAAGAAELVSSAPGGAPANGPSYGPDLDGDQIHDGLDAKNRPQGRDGPHCVAFVSAASNLVPGDTNGTADAFVRDLRTGRTTRVSVDSFGRQANGATYDVQVDGGCDRVAFSSDASNLALTRKGWRRTRKKLWASAVTSAPAPGQRQVYVRMIKDSDRSREPDDSGLTGLTFLASTHRGRAANGPSYDVSLGELGRGTGCPARCTVTSGDTLAYTSEATNLARGDRTATADVYKLGFGRERQRRRSRGRAASFGMLRLRTALVSVTPGGRGGNGPSGHPAINSDGRYVAFDTHATDILPCERLAAGTVCESNGVSDVARADTGGKRPRVVWVSASRAIGQPGNGPSAHPSMTRYGSLFFESAASNLQRQPANGLFSDRNGVGDVFFWSTQTRFASLQSRDSDDRVLGLPKRSTDPEPAIKNAPSSGAATSYYNNYVLFETSNPLVELPLARRVFPGLVEDRDAAARRASADPTLHQVYLRYIGPR